MLLMGKTNELVDDVDMNVFTNTFFTQEQITAIRKTWLKVELAGIENVGKIFFTYLFEMVPYTLQLFPFKNESDIYNSK